jgi:fibronectin type 3 domain-containing protein
MAYSAAPLPSNYDYHTALGPTAPVFATAATARLLSAPASPGSLSVSSSSPTSADLVWPAVDGADTYRIERSRGTAGFTAIATVAENRFADIGLSTNVIYRYRVTALGPGGTSEASPTAQITPVVATNLPAPTSLSVRSEVPGRLQLNWTATTPANGAILIQRSIDGGNTFTDLVTLPGNARTFTDTVQRATLYAYRIRANTFTATSPITGSVSVLTPPPDVTSLLRTAVTETTTELTWTPVLGATGYVIEQASEDNPFAVVATIAGGIVRAEVTGLQPGTVYQYRIRATNSGGGSNNTLVSGVLTVPSAPADLRLENVDGPFVKVTFNPVKGATSYVLERQSDGRLYARLATLPANTTSYTDILVTVGDIYEYRVKAINESGESVYSAAAAIGVSAAGDLAVPYNLRATPGTAPNTLQLTWTIDEPVAGFTVQRRFGAGWRTLAMTTGATTATLRGLKPGEATNVRVIASAGGGIGSPSPEIMVQLAPTAPTRLRLLTPVTPTSVSLIWLPAIGSETFRLERSVDRVTWTAVATDITVASYVDSTFTPGLTYAYRVFASNPTGSSPASATFFVPTTPSTPSGISAAPSSKVGSFLLTWSDVEGETGYRIQASIDGVRWSNVAVAKANATSAELKPGKNLFFRIQAQNRAGASNPTNPISAP